MKKIIREKLAGKRGYTLMELLTVAGIIAIVCAIAIPSVIAISRSLKFKRVNDYAKSVYMAVQQNLTDRRVNGSLDELELLCVNGGGIGIATLEDSKGFPTYEDGTVSEQYYYSTSEGKADFFALLLPEDAIDPAVRGHNILVEYNPVTGNVYSVFYSEEGIPLSYDNIVRGEKERKKIGLGYYCGSAFDGSELDPTDVDAEGLKLNFENGEEGLVKVYVPIPSEYQLNADTFMRSLEIELTIKRHDDSFVKAYPAFADKNGEPANIYIDENGKATEEAKIKIKIKQFDSLDYCELDKDGRRALITYPIDSLIDYNGFSVLSYAPQNGNAAKSKAAKGSDANQKVRITDIKDESAFRIFPGENVDLEAVIYSKAADGGILAEYTPEPCEKINPMFDSLKGNGDNLTLVVTNGRNLQNLNCLSPVVSTKITTVQLGREKGKDDDGNVLSADGEINWNETVTYYNNKYGTRKGGSKEYTNTVAESPARALPYFVPIYNSSLFGAADFRYLSDIEATEGLWSLLSELAYWTVQGLTGIDYQNKNVPILTDELDGEWVNGEFVANHHASIKGVGGKNGCRVSYLNIDTNKYSVGNPGEVTSWADIRTWIEWFKQRNVGWPSFYSGVTKNYRVYSEVAPNRDRFTGLFSYINTDISGIQVVNPIIKGFHFTDLSSNNPCTGALVGCAGFNTVITNCSVYLDTEDKVFDRGKMTATDYTYNKDADQTWYGVSGEGAVGGLVGYAKSHRTVEGNLGGDGSQIAFSKSFAAVTVSGTMREKTENAFGGEVVGRSHGYSNGVGGLVGNGQLTNFVNCYASGNVYASNAFVSEQRVDFSKGRFVEAIGNFFGENRQGNIEYYKGWGIFYDGGKSWGGGGFIGSSHGCRFTNCFSTGSVIGNCSSPEVGGIGAFVGLMCYDEDRNFGVIAESAGNEKIQKQRTVFSSCYCVGSAERNGVVTESFSGSNATISQRLSDMGRYTDPNYYYYTGRYLYLTRNTQAPEYAEDGYVFKDCYYLQRSGSDNVSSNVCAQSAQYDLFTTLHEYTKGTAGRLDALKKTVIEDYSAWNIDLTERKILGVPYSTIFGSDSINIAQYMYDRVLKSRYNSVPEYGNVYSNEYFAFTMGEKIQWSILGATFDVEIFGQQLYKGGYFSGKQDHPVMNYEYYFDAYDAWQQSRDSQVKMDYLFTTQYDKGFDSKYWEAGTAQNTHSYSATGTVKAYPFSKLAGLDYYGDWPEKPAESGIGYYEKYKTTDEYGNVGYQYGFYFNKEENNSLNHELEIVEDGYAVFTANQSDALSVRIGDTVYGLGELEYIGNFTESVNISDRGSMTYTVYLLPEQQKPKDETNFYTQVKITVDDSAEFYSYYNPALAISNVNFGLLNETLSDQLPPQMFVRTARQLKAVSELNERFFAEDCVYVQMRHIDPSTELYDDPTTQGEDMIELSTVTVSIPSFNGIYSGSGGYVDKAEIKNLSTTGLFAALGEQASVRALRITDPKFSGTGEDSGILAGSCAGSVDDVSIDFSSSVSLGADSSKNSGILLGSLSGTVTNVTLESGGDITLTGENVGFIGKIAPAESEEGGNSPYINGVELSGKGFVLNGKENAGLLAGTVENASISGVNVGGTETGEAESTVQRSLTIRSSSAANTGAVFGSIRGSGVTGLTVSLAGENSASGILAGIAAKADNSSFEATNVTLQDGRMFGASASGAFGELTKGTVENVKITLGGVVGSTGSGGNAAGFVLNADKDSNISNCDVVFSNANAAVSSATGDAAGFAVNSGAGLDHIIVLLSENKAANGGRITANNGNAAGLVCSSNGKLLTCVVNGTGEISAKGSAAGLAVALESGTVKECIVSPVRHFPNTEEQLQAAYKGNSNEHLSVSGSKAAAFAVSVGNKSYISESTALGKVSGTSEAAGFIVENGGTVATSYANVGGSITAFIGKNNGSVMNCYAWYDNGTADSISGDETGTYSGCYFAPILRDNKAACISAGNERYKNIYGTVFPVKGTPVTLTVFENNADVEKEIVGDGKTGYNVNLSSLTADALDGDVVVWKQDELSAFMLYPYSNVRPNNYEYPMLRGHYGDWQPTPPYSFGVVYYEQLADDSVNMKLVDASHSEINRDLANYSMDNIEEGNKGETVKTGYLFFAHSPAQLVVAPETVSLNEFSFEGLKPNFKGLRFSDGTACSAEAFLEDYSFFEPDSDFDTLADTWPTVEGQPKDLSILPVFARAISAPGEAVAQPYEIRTGEQFAAIESFSGSDFSQTRSITLDSAAERPADCGSSLTSFTGNYAGGGNELTVRNNTRIFGGNNVQMKSIRELTVIGDGSFDAPLVAGSLIGGTFEKLGVTLAKNASSSAALVANSSSIGTFRNLTVSGTVTSSAGGESIGLAFNTITGSSFRNIAVSGSLTANAASVGGFAGYVSGGEIGADEGKKSTVKVNVTANSGTKNAGGFAGYVKEGNGIFNTVSSGKLTTYAENAGGFVGLSENGAFGYCEWTGESLTANSGTNVGGFAGKTIDGMFVSGKASGSVSGSGSIGGFAGYTEKGVFQSNTASGSVSGSGSVGGFIGNAQTSQVITSTSSASVSGSGKIGGFFGEAKDASVTDAKASGSITAANATYTGGFIGYMDHGCYTNNTSSGAILQADGSDAGGFAGYLLSGEMHSNAATGGVTSSASYVGGFAGRLIGAANGNNVIDGATVSGTVSGGSSVGGLAAVIENYNSTVDGSDPYITRLDLSGLTVNSGYAVAQTFKNSILDNASAVIPVGRTAFGTVSGGMIQNTGFSGTPSSGEPLFADSISESILNNVGITATATGSTALVTNSISGGSFTDVTVSGNVSYGGTESVGLAFNNVSGGEFTNVTVSGSLTATGAAANVGGFAGSISGAEITESSATAVVSGNSSGNVGGFAGNIESGSLTNVNCNVGSTVSTGKGMGTVDGETPSGYAGAGKFVGRLAGGTLTNCWTYATGDSDYQFLGTIVPTQKSAAPSGTFRINSMENSITVRRSSSETGYSYNGQQIVDSTGANKYQYNSVNLEGCYFYFNNELNVTAREQYIADQYYYTAEAEKSHETYWPIPVTSFTDGHDYLIGSSDGTEFMYAKGSGVLDHMSIEIKETQGYTKAEFKELRDDDNAVWKRKGNKLYYEENGKYVLKFYDLLGYDTHFTGELLVGADINVSFNENIVSYYFSGYGLFDRGKGTYYLDPLATDATSTSPCELTLYDLILDYYYTRVFNLNSPTQLCTYR